MKYINSIIIAAFIVLTSTSNAQTAYTSELPEIFQTTIPVELKGNLELVEVKIRCNGCAPWRYIDYYSNASKEPVRVEKVTVEEGYRAMYAYPGTHYFSNTKIEKSSKNSYKNDKATVIDALKHEFNRKKDLIYSYLKENPELIDKIAPFRAKDKDYIELEEASYKGYEYISYTENVIGLTGSTISQIHIFVPEKEIIITAYLLRQEKSKFSTIEEFLNLRSEFIESYIEFLYKNRK